MPKERRTRSVSFERRSRASPFPCSSSDDQWHSSSSSHNPPDSALALAKDIKEWEEVHCPVCMEYPHNAVLLLCSSNDKGCRPFMCDTSYRHSNCLDQYRKSFSGTPESQGDEDGQQQAKLTCPLCRGVVSGWKVVEPARRFMNSKARCCSMESCGFVGVYGELRKHARKEHPSVRPSEADPERQRDWRRLEQQRDLGDLFSMFQSPASGDEDGVGASEDDEGLSRSIISFPSITVFLVVHVRQAGAIRTGRPSLHYSRSSLRGSSRSRRGRGMILWGETFSDPDSTNRMDDARINNEIGNDSHEIGSEEASAASQHGHGRRRRQLRMSDDEDVDDDDFL